MICWWSHGWENLRIRACRADETLVRGANHDDSDTLPGTTQRICRLFFPTSQSLGQSRLMVAVTTPERQLEDLAPDVLTASRTYRTFNAFTHEAQA